MGDNLSGYEASVLSWIMHFPDAPEPQRNELIQQLGPRAKTLAHELVADRAAPSHQKATKKMARSRMKP